MPAQRLENHKLRTAIKNTRQRLNSETCAILAVLIFSILFFKPAISGGDAYGYYAILEGVGKYHTLNLSNEQKYNEISGMQYITWNNATQKYVSKYAPGSAILSLPLYELSLVLDNFKIFHIADEAFIKMRGDILIHQLSVTATALIFLAISFYYINKSMDTLGIQRRFRAIALVFFGSPIMLYATQYGSYTHALEAGIFSAMIYYSVSKNKQQPYASGILAGIISMVRYPDILLSAINYDYFKSKKWLARFAIGILPFILLLALYFKAQYGSYFTTGYAGEKAYGAPVYFLSLLFDFNNGILFWTPVFFISIYGLLIFKGGLRARLLLPVVLLVLFYSGTSYWHSCWSFGNRYFVVLFPLLCIGTGKALDEKPGLKGAVYFSAAYSFLLGMLFLASTAQIQNPCSLANQIGFWSSSGSISGFLPGIYDKMFLLRFLLGSPL